MPYVIDRPHKRTLLAACGVLLALVFMAVAARPAAAAATSCSTPSLTQVFSSFGDTNWYALPGGESYDSFSGAGWTLSGGAKLVRTTLYDGSTGYVLDLPSGSKAVSPNMCVSANYPTMRTMVRNVVGSEGVFFYVEYQGTSTWGHPKNTGQVHGQATAWTLATPVNIQPSNVSGWQIARFTFIPGGTTSDFQLYNFYIDPYGRG
jgi:hypothetical protein